MGDLSSGVDDADRRNRIRGCLLGGAAGDALGSAVEFQTLAEIRSQFGPQGIEHHDRAYGRVGAITDNTQMSLFTAEGCIRASVRQQTRGICDWPGVIHHALLRWLLSQGERPRRADLKISKDGWLFGLRGLHARRSPGPTCLSSLGDAVRLGMPAVANYRSKGCGGVMGRVPGRTAQLSWLRVAGRHRGFGRGAAAAAPDRCGRVAWDWRSSVARRAREVGDRDRRKRARWGQRRRACPHRPAPVSFASASRACVAPLLDPK